MDGATKAAVSWVDLTAERYNENMGPPFAAGLWAAAFEFILALSHKRISRAEVLVLRQRASESFCSETLSQFHGGGLPPREMKKGKELFHMACEDVRNRLLGPFVNSRDKTASIKAYVASSELSSNSKRSTVFEDVDATGVWAIIALTGIVDSSLQAVESWT